MAVNASQSISVSASSSVESGQDIDLPTIRFTNMEDLFNVVNHTDGDFLAVTHVSPTHFTEIEREREKRRRKFRFRRYDSARQTLLITTPTLLHETLHLEIYEGYLTQLIRSGRKRGWRSMGATTRRAQGHPGGDVGEGDSTGGPYQERGMKGAWPTLVVEAGVSEPLAGLRNQMSWWFSASDHHVKMVILAKFDYARHAITLEKWEEEPGGTMTTHATTLQPVLRQSITITQDTTTEPMSYNVTGPLVFGFSPLFLRDPGPGEGDVVLSVEELNDYAEDVWNML